MANRRHRGEDALNALEAELFNEKVESLGRAGRKAQALLQQLAAFDDPDSDPVAHDRLLADAAAAVWNFMVQRELCGLGGASDIIRDLAVPPAVVARLGVRPAAGPPQPGRPGLPR